ncbi:pentatricopeptide repeat-containing protein [Canna indica]|uniref:Pentatricopeptide repeat-containing protein n=1 Tax=Canna indica TaxID=4628 RepID=A0AAQ3JTA6_9LILI|nr:pentatricopeptide repeat-containing protein [Canna indica]
MFDEMRHRNVVSWTTLISAQTRSGNPDMSIRSFAQMLNDGSTEPNRYTYSAALKSCSMVGNLQLGKQIHGHVLKNSNLQSDVVLMNTIIDMYVKCGSLSEARRVFDEFSLANSTSWNTIISGYFREGNALEAENLFHNFPIPDAISYNAMIAGFAEIGSSKALGYVYLMHSRGIKLDHYTLPCALKTCGNFKFEKMGKQIHSYIIKCGSVSSCFIGSSLIDMYSNCSQINDAVKLYDEFLGHKTCFSNKLPLLNSMISGFVTNGYNIHALNLILEVHSSGTQLDHFTFSSALQLCSNLQCMRIGRQVHGLVIISGFQIDHIVGSNLVGLYSRCGNLVDALRLFQDLPQKDIIAWTELITGCLLQGSNELVFYLFRELIRLKINLDDFVVSSILKACSVISWVHGGKQVHAYIVKGGFESESITVTSLIDMYSKCGDIDDGFRVFECAAKKDTVCWTGIIAGCGNNGKATEALKLFQEMIKAKVEPNEITFLSVLSACRHAGLVEEACRIFKSMQDSSGVKPRVEHRHCLIDILCRAGLFNEAKQLISEMSNKLDENKQNSLLSDWLIHQNSEIGKVDLFQSISCDASSYVALSNAYASKGLWDVSAKCREISRRVHIKNAGKSWLQIRTQ